MVVTGRRANDGKPVSLAIGGSKLRQTIILNWMDIVDKVVILKGFGTGYDREYTIELKE